MQKRLSRRKLLKLGLWGTTAAGLGTVLWEGGCTGKSIDTKPKNVLLISIDTLRADHLGCYGYGRPTSPVMDRLAEEGVLFEDVTANSPWTLPSHASMLTGLYPNRHGVKSYATVLPKTVPTLGDIFQAKGYQTAAIVNSHCLTPRYELLRGFQDYEYVKEVADQRRPSQVGELGLNWLQEKGRDPFFLFLHYFDVHSDYASMPEYEEQFVRPYQGKADGTTQQLVAFCMGQVRFDRPSVDHLIDLYDSGIRQIDNEVGKILQHLQAKELLDDTLVILTSDHGEEFLEHGGVLHSQTQFQELLHVPLMMRWPGLGKNMRIPEMVTLVDLMPTVLSIMGLETPEKLDGLDLSGYFRRKKQKIPARFVYAGASKLTGPMVFTRPDQHDIRRAVRHRRYKLHYNTLTKETMLFDLKNDWGEKKDLSREHDQLVKSMMHHLEGYLTANEVGETLPSLSVEEVQKLKSMGYL